MGKGYKIIDDVLFVDEEWIENYGSEFKADVEIKRTIKKAILPEGITKIVYWGFGGCSKLEEVVLPASIESIDCEAFAMCPLKKVVFTDNCPRLTELYRCSFKSTSDDNLWYKNLRKENEFFIWGKRLVMHGIGPSLAVIPKGIEIIGEGAFQASYEEDYVDNVEQVVMPEGVKIIEDYAFAGCEKLTSVVIPDTLRTLGKCAFSSCTNLSSITMPDGIETIGDYAFAGCENFKEVVLPSNLKTLGQDVFVHCSKLEKIVFPLTLKSIDENKFGDKRGTMPVLEGLIPLMLNGCKINSKTNLWLLDNLWNDEESIKEIALLYLTQSGVKVSDKANLLLWRYSEQAVLAMREIQNEYKLKPTAQKKLDAFLEKYA